MKNKILDQVYDKVGVQISVQFYVNSLDKVYDNVCNRVGDQIGYHVYFEITRAQVIDMCHKYIGLLPLDNQVFNNILDDLYSM